MAKINIANDRQDAEKQQAQMELAETTRSGKTFIPRADIYESGNQITVLADMPGVDENHVDITLEKNVLTIHGHVEPINPEGYTLAYAEFLIGDYHRAFTLSNEIDRELIDASVKNGVLKLTLPKSKEAAPRKITVKGE